MPELAFTLESTEDERLDQAEGVVRAYCGWHIAPSREDVETLPTAGGMLMLRSLHVTSVESVTYSDGTVIDPSRYAWNAAGMLQLLDARCSDSLHWNHHVGVTVHYTHGYPSAPAELVGVVRAIAQRATDNPHGITQQTTGPFSITYSTAGGQAASLSVLAGERVALDHYRLNPRP